MLTGPYPWSAFHVRGFSNPTGSEKHFLLSAESSLSLSGNKSISTFPTFKMLVTIQMRVTIHMLTLNEARASPEEIRKGQFPNTCVSGCDRMGTFTSVFCVELSPLCYRPGIFVPGASEKPETELLSIKGLAQG